MEVNSLPILKTAKQRRNYIESLGLLFSEYNDFSKILVNGRNPERHSEGFHFLETVDVITEPFKSGVESKTQPLRLVNIGTYFSGFRQSNFFVSESDYASFTADYTPKDYARFTRDHNDAQELAKINGEKPTFKYELFCTSNLQASFEEHGKYIVQPVMFVRSNPCGDRPSRVMHYELADWFCKSVIGAVLEKNMEIVRYIQQGNTEPLRDRFAGEQIEKVRLPIKTDVVANTYELHHIKVRNGKSADKNGVDPASLLRRYDIVNSVHKFDIITEFMKTISISKNSHGLVHKLWHSGLSDYYEEQWPWALQSEENFRAVCERYGLGDLDYDQFIEDLK